MIMIGCGTGRCGTVTLSLLLNSQKGFRIGHESIRMPWEFDKDFADKALRFFRANKMIIGDIASWYLPYTKFFLQQEDRVRVICIKRPKKEMINSFLKKKGWKQANHWTAQDSEYYDKKNLTLQAFDMHFPKYDLPIEQALGKYWEDYYIKASALEKRFKKRFKIFDMYSILNTNKGQDDLFLFLGIKNPKKFLGLKANRHNSLKMMYKIWAKENDL